MNLTEEQLREIETLRAQQNISRRPISEGMEAWIHQPLPVLDHGFVRVVDYMGNDEAIVQAARVSYGAGTKAVSNDRGLIRYLMSHQHSTPFEMCLAGDVRVPSFPAKGAKVKHYTMEQLATAFAVGGRENAWVKLLKIRTVNPTTGLVTATKIKRAWQTGSRMVYEVVTEAPFNRKIRLTDNHPILTPTGFRQIAQGLSVGDEIMHNGLPALEQEVVAEISRRRAANQTIVEVGQALGISPSTVYKYSQKRAARTAFWSKAPGEHADPRAIARKKFTLGDCSLEGCSDLARDRHHIDENPHNNSDTNVIGLCAKHHRHMHTMGRLHVAVPAKIVSIVPVGVQPVYDLEVEDANHTFVAEGIVVHNCEVKLHVKLPIFVARQWIRHRTANVNEYSARYSILDREFYIPELKDIQPQSEDNKQGRAGAYEQDQAQALQNYLISESDDAYEAYSYLISPDHNGNSLARETARMVLPTNIYTQWYWKTDLHNLFRFIQLRADPHAQFEIRCYAQAIADVVKDWVPLAYEAFKDYQQDARTFSAKEMEFLSFLVRADETHSILNEESAQFGQDVYGLSKREAQAFLQKLKITE